MYPARPFLGAALVAALSCLPWAASKGCFTETAEVTMADGTKKQLKDVRVGDEVSSYDEASKKAVKSKVMAVPTFSRKWSEVVEVSLPAAVFYATEDHPMWSRSQGHLVSFHPNGTKREYDLEAKLLAAGEELEDELQRPVSVLATRRVVDGRAAALDGAALQQARSLRGLAADGDTATVMTLCLQPHHWYYVHGVRVHNKGCFLEDTKVTLADGSRKQLKDVSVGDKVASWDEVAQKSAISTVRARPTFQRLERELVHLALPTASIMATEDHPFWSRSRRGLVSMHPNGTQQEYGLAAQLLGEGEELEDEDGQAVSLMGARRVGELASSSSLQLRQLRGVGVANETTAPARVVEVMTLCLEPHHWFYAEGVRVHNKGGGGCFVPWTPILMGDGAHKPIEDVRVDDRVTSWDEGAGRLVQATVVGIDVFPGRSMLEISYTSRPVTARQLRSSEGQAADGAATSLIVTHDHPIYSARSRGLVSMEPNMTLARYALTVGQMQDQEMLHHHQGHHLPADVRQWKGNASKVMTLRLDRYHWFYAQGVRVHNKGGGGGSGGFGGGRSVHTRSSMGAAGFAGFIIMSGGTRRRYGTYNSEEGACQMHPASTVSSNCQVTVSPYCTSSGSASGFTSTTSETCCHDCLACENEMCTQGITGCQTFLSDSFAECVEEGDGNVGLIIAGVIGAIGAILVAGVLIRKGLRAQERDKELEERAKEREEMEAEQGALPARLVFSGTYSENGETKTTTYTLNMNAGLVCGTSLDDDGHAEVNGKVHSSQGLIKLCEVREGVTIEISGSITQDGLGGYRIEADYLSSYQNTRGQLQLATAAMGTVVVAAAAPCQEGAPNVVMAQVVGNTVVPGTQVQQ